MKSENQLNNLISKFYTKTYGSKISKSPTNSPQKKQNFDSYNLIKIVQTSEKLPPIIKRAINYLYPKKVSSEVEPSSEYDKIVRKLSKPSLNDTEISPVKKRLKLKKLSLNDIHNIQLCPHKSNSQEYINCIGYNGQAESEYMMTKEGINEYKNLYSLVLKDSGISLEKRPKKSLGKKKKKFFKAN